MKQAYCLLQSGFLLGLLFNPEHGNGMFLQNAQQLATGATLELSESSPHPHMIFL
jgi:hypothetical protein